MKYQFRYEVTAADLWTLSISATYRSLAGVCNVIFTVAAILLTIKAWRSYGVVAIIIMTLMCCLFPVIQPLLIYAKSKKQVSNMPKDMEIGFDDIGIHVKTPDQVSEVPWGQVRGITENANMIIISSGGRRGFALPTRMLGKDKDGFLAYATERTESLRAGTIL